MKYILLKTLVVFDKDIKNSLNQISSNENSGSLVKEFSSYANVYTSKDSKLEKSGQITGYSQNRFEKNTNTVYVSREDNIFLPYGNLQLNFNLSTNYKDINVLPKLDIGTILTLEPVFKSKCFNGKIIRVRLKIFDGYRIYKIYQIC